MKLLVGVWLSVDVLSSVNTVCCLQWEGGAIVGLGWTTSENLVCILEEGTMVVYDLRGEQVFARVIARVSSSCAVFSCLHCP